jgi:23S rRNA (guanosine2251-2'-O)-methyltransferase
LNENDNLIYGTRPVIESLKAGKEFDKIFIQKGLRSEQVTELYQLIRMYDAPFQHVPIEKLNRLTRKNHQGVVGFVSVVSYQPIEEVVQRIYERSETPLIIVLDGVTDVRNFGAIVRTAECAGAHAILFPTQGSAQLNADTMKTSAGALNHMAVCRTKNLNQALDYLQQSGIQLVAATEKAEELLYEADYTIPTAILMGSEESGISPAYLHKANYQVHIPMLGHTESLNVSVAAGVLLYEAVRQRKNIAQN